MDSPNPENMTMAMTMMMNFGDPLSPAPPLQDVSSSRKLSFSDSPLPVSLLPLEPILQTVPKLVSEVPLHHVLRKKRGRKTRNVTEEQKEAAVAKRIERNRHFARENRIRKKQYIRMLENKVTELTDELMVCKARLAEYEERDRLPGMQEFYQRIKADTQYFAQKRLMEVANILRGTAEKNLGEIIHTLKTTVVEKEQMIDAMSETMIDFSVPVPYRYMIRFACDSSIRAEEEGCGLGLMIKQIRRDWDTIMVTAPETRLLFQRAAVRLNDVMTHYFSSMKEIKRQMNELDLYLIERVAPKLRASCLDSMIQWMQTWSEIPRLSHLCGGAVAVVELRPATGKKALKEHEEDTDKVG